MLLASRAEVTFFHNMGDSQQKCSVLRVISVVVNNPLSLNITGHTKAENATFPFLRRAGRCYFRPGVNK